jgi:hypothetical protein
LKASAAETSAATHLHNLATAASWDLLLMSLSKSEIVEFLSVELGQLLGFLDLLLNQLDLLCYLSSF